MGLKVSFFQNRVSKPRRWNDGRLDHLCQPHNLKLTQRWVRDSSLFNWYGEPHLFPVGVSDHRHPPRGERRSIRAPFGSPVGWAAPWGCGSPAPGNRSRPLTTWCWPVGRPALRTRPSPARLPVSLVPPVSAGPIPDGWSHCSSRSCEITLRDTITSGKSFLSPFTTKLLCLIL